MNTRQLKTVRGTNGNGTSTSNSVEERSAKRRRIDVSVSALKKKLIADFHDFSINCLQNGVNHAMEFQKFLATNYNMNGKNYIQLLKSADLCLIVNPEGPHRKTIVLRSTYDADVIFERYSLIQYQIGESIIWQLSPFNNNIHHHIHKQSNIRSPHFIRSPYLPIHVQPIAHQPHTLFANNSQQSVRAVSQQPVQPNTHSTTTTTTTAPAVATTTTTSNESVTRNNVEQSAWVPFTTFIDDFDNFFDDQPLNSIQMKQKNHANDHHVDANNTVPLDLKVATTTTTTNEATTQSNSNAGQSLLFSNPDSPTDIDKLFDEMFPNIISDNDNKDNPFSNMFNM